MTDIEILKMAVQALHAVVDRQAAAIRMLEHATGLRYPDPEEVGDLMMAKAAADEDRVRFELANPDLPIVRK